MKPVTEFNFDMKKAFNAITGLWFKKGEGFTMRAFISGDPLTTVEQLFVKATYDNVGFAPTSPDVDGWH